MEYSKQQKRANKTHTQANTRTNIQTIQTNAEQSKANNIKAKQIKSIKLKVNQRKAKQTKAKPRTYLVLAS